MKQVILLKIPLYFFQQNKINLKIKFNSQAVQVDQELLWVQVGLSPQCHLVLLGHHVFPDPLCLLSRLWDPTGREDQEGLVIPLNKRFKYCQKLSQKYNL